MRDSTRTPFASRISAFPFSPLHCPSPMSNTEAAAGVRWGLCCLFVDAPIRFRTATHRYVAGLAPDARRAYLSDIVRANAAALHAAVAHCHALGIGAFR